MGTAEDQNRRDTSHFVVRSMDTHPTGVLFPVYWLGPDERGSDFRTENRGHVYGGLPNAWKATTAGEAEAHLIQHHGTLETAKRRRYEAMTVAEAQAGLPQLVGRLGLDR
jgi:hypothetical protein